MSSLLQGAGSSSRQDRFAVDSDVSLTARRQAGEGSGDSGGSGIDMFVFTTEASVFSFLK